MPMDRRTPKEKRNKMVADRVRRQGAALVLVNELHDAGFSGIFMDSTQISGDGHYYIKVIIDQDDLSHDRVATIMDVAEVHNAKVMLTEVRMNQQSFSKIALWPFAEDDDA